MYEVLIAHVVPPFVVMARPKSVAASTCMALVRSIAMLPMKWPANIACPTTVHDVPPLVLLRMPWPACESLRLFSPVPAKMICPVGSIASDPIAREAALSVRGDQLVPPVGRFQTAPPGLPAKTVEAFVGSATRLVTRPDTLPKLLTGALPQQRSSTTGVGPIALQAPPTPAAAGEGGVWARRVRAPNFELSLRMVSA